LVFHGDERLKGLPPPPSSPISSISAFELLVSTAAPVLGKIIFGEATTMHPTQAERNMAKHNSPRTMLFLILLHLLSVDGKELVKSTLSYYFQKIQQKLQKIRHSMVIKPYIYEKGISQKHERFLVI
jgi:hypothetical protein